MPGRRTTTDFPRVFFFASCGFLLFLAGVAVGRYRVFPYPALEAGKTAFDRTWGQVAITLGGRPKGYLKPARYEGRGVTRFPPGNKDFTLLAGFFDRDNEVRLIRADGTLVRRWPVRAFDAFPDMSHVTPRASAPKTNWDVEIQGILASPDGSVIVNIGDVGLAKLDRCGAVQWRLPRVTHHSVERAEGGGFWVPSHRYVEGRSPFPSLKPPFVEETVLKVSEEGKVLQEVSVLDLMFKDKLQALLFANGMKGIALASSYPDSPINPTHLNDVEELSTAMAARFPQFAPGDLLISIRNLNLILVADPAAGTVKWRQIGPWVKQHDPDFEADGTISVFNNNDDGTPTGAILGGSNIVSVDPRTGDTTIAYGAAAGQHMFTDIMGRLQRLPDGHLLITESRAGRAFEVDRDGRLVWEFVNRYDDKDVALLTQAIRYPDGYFTVDNWSCP